MSEQESVQTVTQPNPVPKGYTSWNEYWTNVHSQPWRTEPEIDMERQQYLAERHAVQPDLEQGIYPFKGVKLSRPDIEWLLATHESDGQTGPVWWDEEREKDEKYRREGLDLRAADLRGQDLRGLPLTCMRGGLGERLYSYYSVEQRVMAAVHLEDATLGYIMRFPNLETGEDVDPEQLRPAHVEGAALGHAFLRGAHLGAVHLEESYLREVHCERAVLSEAHLERADLLESHLEDAVINGTHFEGARMLFVHMEGAMTDSMLGTGGAHFEGADITESYLIGTRLPESHLEGVTLHRADLTKAVLTAAHLENADLWAAQLEGAYLAGAYLAGADLSGSNLRGADLSNAHLEGKKLNREEVALLQRWKEDFPHTLMPTDLRGAFLDTSTVLNDIQFGDKSMGFASVADVRWGGVNLAVTSWQGAGRREHLKTVVLGDERLARQARDAEDKPKTREMRLSEFEAAARANRQLAIVLREQGLNDQADHFAYRAQGLQREVLLGERRYLSAFGSLFLDLISGYGYRPMRSFIAYIVVILAFAAAYFGLGGSNGQPLSWNEAIVVSMTAFHGRGFFSTVFQPGDLLAAVAAGEASLGLLIEIVLIATFTQRFFAR